MSATTNLSASYLAGATRDAYSHDRYGRVEWTECAQLLLDRGLDEEQAEAFLRSKHLRWAADAASTEQPTAADLAAYLDKSKSLCVASGLAREADRCK